MNGGKTSPKFVFNQSYLSVVESILFDLTCYVIKLITKNAMLKFSKLYKVLLLHITNSLNYIPTTLTVSNNDWR